jgi:DNA-binding NtrC family response regulator
VEREALRALIRLALRSTALQRRLAALENRAPVVDEPEFDEADELQSYEGILTRSSQMLSVIRTLKDLEDGDVSVLVQGETGTGKELVARAIHARSRRSGGPFVAVNLGAISDTLRESELFGHVRGAFTGASGSRGGRFLEANHGCLFLDEVGDASPSLQAALLRALEERAVTPVGADRPRQVDVRIISATNRPLEDLVRRGGFRRDLYYRLNVFNIGLPPLRERPEDIFPLANEFLERAARALGRQVAGISRDARRVLEEYRWEGNIRELRNVMERAAIVCRGGLIVAADLPVSPEAKPDEARPGPVFDFPPGGFRLRTIEQEIFRQTLAFAAGNQSRAARMLGMNESTFRFRLRKLGIATRAANGS